MRKFSAFSTCFIQYVGYTSGDVYGIVSRHEPLKNRFRHRGVVLALTLAELQPRLLLEMDAYAEEVDTMIDAALDAPSGCWGAELSGEVCTPGFVPGQAHFKNKFCAACREHGVAIPAQKIMVTAINGRFKNTNGRAPWSSGFRVVNQTAKCTGPNVVIFKDVPDEMDDQLVGPPDEWLRRDANGGAFVVFAVSKGTLVPVLAPAQLENLSLRRLMAESHAGACSPVADRATLLNAQLVLEQMASRRLDCERTSAGIVDEPLSEAETRALTALLEASRCASRALQSARPHGTMLSQATLPLDHADDGRRRDFLLSTIATTFDTRAGSSCDDAVVDADEGNEPLQGSVGSLSPRAGPALKLVCGECTVSSGASARRCRPGGSHGCRWRLCLQFVAVLIVLGCISGWLPSFVG